MKTTKTYTVTVYEQNTWNADGSKIVVRDCGHSHRSMRAAFNCREKLFNYDPCGGRDGNWFHAVIPGMTQGDEMEIEIESEADRRGGY